MRTTLTGTAASATIGRSSHYDAIVVGARPAGAATAMLLARGGRHVLLVDRAEYGSDTLSTHALMRAGVLQLHRWGLIDDVRAAGTPAIRRAVFHYGDDEIDIALRSQHGVDALYAPRRTVLDRILVDAARDAGVEVRFGVRVSGLVRDPDGRVAGVRAATADGAEATACAPIVIGADGAHSTVARSVGAPIEHKATDASAFVYGYFAAPEIDAYHWYFRRGVSAGVIPTNDDRSNVFVGLPPARFAESARTHNIDWVFRTVLAEAAPELAAHLWDQTPTERPRSFRGQPGFLRRAHGPGWALVGDAGSFKDPLSSHGISDALRDAELLARALLDMPADAPDAAEYQTIRDELSRGFLDASAAMASYRWTLDRLRGLHRELKLAMDVEVDVLAGLDAEVRHVA